VPSRAFVSLLEVRQSQKLDPERRYLRRWLPELQKVPMELIHEPCLGGAVV
jgi:deoxyribodipyrimidine photolyase